VGVNVEKGSRRGEERGKRMKTAVMKAGDDAMAVTARIWVVRKCVEGEWSLLL
jgi:hypothetical protein